MPRKAFPVHQLMVENTTSRFFPAQGRPVVSRFHPAAAFFTPGKGLGRFQRWGVRDISSPRRRFITLCPNIGTACLVMNRLRKNERINLMHSRY